MFFAETLGPAITPSSAVALAQFVRERLGTRSVSAAELHTTVVEFLRLTNNSTAPESVIRFLADRRIAAPEGRNFKIAA